MSAIFPASGFRKATPYAPQTTKPVPIPAPNMGINAVDGLAHMDAKEAVFMFNMVPSNYGPRVRTGYREWVTDVGTDGIRTIIPYTGSVEAENRLFACAGDGIYDVSASGTSPAPELSFGTADATSGMGAWTNFVNDNGDYLCLYTDETNGYMIYDEGTNTWAVVAMGVSPGEISNVDPADLVFVMSHKERIWFVERGTAIAWYLPTGQATGAAVDFNFGNKFKHGGHLVALLNWTVDGGAGVDDYLVAVSSGGDVVVYKGYDPSSATTWELHGVWFIGPPPAGRRISGSFGGELYLLSSYGLLPMSKLIAGALVQQQDVYLSAKISPLINEKMIFTRLDYGWEVRLIPTENILCVATPKRTSYPYAQFVYSLNTPGWATYLDVPYFTGDTWEGNFYFGGEDGIIYVHTGDLDNVSLDGLTDQDIEWSCLTTFQDVGAAGVYKRVHFVRPVFVAQNSPSISVEARYDYNMNQAIMPPAVITATTGTWDDPFSLWDGVTWGGDFVTVEQVLGTKGLGRAIAIAMSGKSRSKTILVRYDGMVDAGGLV